MSGGRLGRFDRYMTGQLLALFGFFSLVLILLYWVNRAVALFDELIGDGQSAWIFLEFTALSLPGIIRLVLPLAAFVAALYVTNRLTAESELVVVQATGYSPFRLARPVIAFGLIVTLLTGVVTLVLNPAAARQLAEREQQVAQNITARLLTEGQFLTPAEGITVYIREIDEDGALHDLFLADTRESRSQVIYTASVAYLVRTDRGPQLVMVDGLAQTLRASDQRLFTTRFEDFTYDVGRLIPAESAPRLRLRQVPSHLLLAPSPALLAELSRSPADLQVEFHSRVNRATMSLVGALLGFSALIVGQFSRFGVWRQVILAVVLVVVVNAAETVGARAAAAAPGAWPAIYMPTLVGLTISYVLLTVAARPGLFSRIPRGAPAPGAPA